MAAEDERKAGETSTAREDGEIAAEREGEPDFTKKHPLECKWTLWFDNPKGGGQKQSTWGQTLRAVYTFDTVEDFWWCAPVAELCLPVHALGSTHTWRRCATSVKCVSFKCVGSLSVHLVFLQYICKAMSRRASCVSPMRL